MITFDTIVLSGLYNIELPIFGRSSRNPYQITWADGLGPPELNVLLAENYTPGGVFINRRALGREVVLRIGLNPDHSKGQTISDLRYGIYGLISPGSNAANQSIDILLLNDNVPQVKTSGYVSKIEIVPFNKEPEIQITVQCLSPYLDSMEPMKVLSFPKSNEWQIDNKGLAPTGIMFDVEFLKDTKLFRIGVQNSNEMRFEGNFRVGDILSVNTNESDRSIVSKRGNTEVARMELMTSESKWVMMYGGIHVFFTSDHTEFKFNNFEYRVRYWGI